MYHTVIGTQDLESAVALLNEQEEYIKELEKRIDEILEENKILKVKLDVLNDMLR